MMTFQIDDAKFHQLLDVTFGDRRIDPRELLAVIQLAQLAASIDLDDDPAERTLLHTLTHRLCAFAGLAADRVRPLSRVPIDDEARAMRIAAVVPQLITNEARNLAFALAYLVIIVDLELAPIETELLDELQRALAIPRGRAGELIDAISRIVTPGQAPAPAAAVADSGH